MITPERLRTAAGWNEMLRNMRRNRIVSLQRWTRKSSTHPWKTRVGWNGETERFEAVIKPGLVNGRAPLVEGVLLTDAPSIPLTAWRTAGVGTGLSGYDPVPAFFTSLGVASATETARDPEAVTRRLLAADIVLNQDRPGLTTVEAGGALTVGVQGSTKLSRATIEVVPKFAGNPAAPDPVQQLAGNWSDSTRDSVLVCTVYVLAPEDADGATPVDETWAPYVKHELFRNLLYAYSDLPNTAKRDDIEVPLTGTIGDTQISGMSDQQNAEMQRAITFITTKRIEGRFWSV